ncbi:MAG: hypothetical protein PF508_00645 [Spirochaeta sp.]|nr:hypothetical protein [Spirochaeta sp.]
MNSRRLPFLVLLLWVGGAFAVGAQANSQAEDRERIELAGLARGPAIVGGGLFFGEPSGISAKLWFPESGFGFDALAAWSFQDEGSVYLHSDVIYHLALIETAGGRYVVPSVGLGVLGRLGDNGSVGVRLPVALSLFLFPSVPLELFGEISPGVGIYPETDEEFGVGLGVRFYLPVQSR